MKYAMTTSMLITIFKVLYSYVCSFGTLQFLRNLAVTFYEMYICIYLFSYPLPYLHLLQGLLKMLPEVNLVFENIV